MPESRYDAVTADPDNLIDDPISREFDELGFVHALARRFDELAGLEEFDGFLDYLVFGPEHEDPWQAIRAETESSKARQWLPRLFERSGYILSKPEQ